VHPKGNFEVKTPHFFFKRLGRYWLLDIDLANTVNNPVNDTITINGGGQIVEAASSTGGILYHAMINCKYNYSGCSKNPTIGNALSQNFKASNDFLDLGSTYLSFHNSCDGNVHVDFSSGKYIGYTGKDVSLGLP
jgi:hypothetical protein